MINLFTSLPPSMNRFDDAGRNIGDHYFRQCIESWLNSNFRVHSVNSDVEKSPEFEHHYAVHRLTVKRDAQELCGKPLTYLHDFLHIAASQSNSIIAMTNADIEFKFSPSDLQCIEQLRRGHFICERRQDYTYGRQEDAKPYGPGFDFFAFHRDDVSHLLDNQLVFGMPWWDYFVPTKLLAIGLIRQALPSRKTIYHLMHDERWNAHNFIEFGEIFRSELERIVKHKNADSKFQTVFERLLWVERNNPVLPYPRRSQFLRNLLRRTPSDPTLNRMFWMGTLCVRFYENPDEARLGLFNPDRFFNRLPF